MPNTNRNLGRAQQAKNDEFYTLIEDIDKEMSHYDTSYFNGKSVYLCCDGLKSAFWDWFSTRFVELRLRRLTATHYEPDTPTYKLVMERDGGDTPHVTKTRMSGSGDFRSDECLRIMDESDIVITNPPFSLNRVLLSTILEHGCDMMVIGTINAITYKSVFPLIQHDKLWFGCTNPKKFLVTTNNPDRTNIKLDKDGNTYAHFGNTMWYVTLDHQERHKWLTSTATYYGNESHYPRYENYDAIDVSKVKELPSDYDGNMGVPVSFLAHHNPDQYEIVHCLLCPIVNGKKLYKRIIIRKRQP